MRFRFIHQINKKSTILRIPRTEMASLTKDLAWAKANELDELKRITETSVIERVKLRHCHGIYGILSIVSVPKDGKKKSKAKTEHTDDDEQMSEMSWTQLFSFNCRNFAYAIRRRIVSMYLLDSVHD